MSFYAQPSFFVVLAIALVPAVVLGFMQKPLRLYGFLASVLFDVLLFADDARAAASFAFFLVVACCATAYTLRSWKTGRKNVVGYRIALAATLLPLAVCKVSGAFDQNLLGFIGISYLTFKALQVLIEIRDGLIKELKPLDYLYFLTFFATFTSGPIDRSRRFAEDLYATRTRKEYADLLSRGIMLLLLGAVYQLVFGTIVHGFFTPNEFSEHNTLIVNVLGAAKDAYAYGIYLFFDFAGYSLMAMGASYCLGIRTPRNFRAPFLALDVKDFWDRWHITLSTWLRDYVFMRFVMWATKNKVFSTRLQTACCGYMIDFLLMGVWHGLTVDYVVYGLYYGVLLAATDIFQKKSKFYKRNKNKLPFKIASWFVTVNLVMLGMSIFSGQAHTIIGGLLHG